MPATSKKQQRFMGMVRATQKGEMKSPSKAVSDAASSMKKTDVKDFAATEHKGLPERKKAAADSLAGVLCKVAGEKEAEGFWETIKPYLPYLVAGGFGGMALGDSRTPWWQRLLGGALMGGAGKYGYDKWLKPWMDQRGKETVQPPKKPTGVGAGMTAANSAVRGVGAGAPVAGVARAATAGERAAITAPQTPVGAPSPEIAVKSRKAPIQKQPYYTGVNFRDRYAKDPSLTGLW